MLFKSGQGCDSLRAGRVTETVGRDTIQRAPHADRRVEDGQIGDEVVVFDHLALLVAGCRSHEPATPEPRPDRQTPPSLRAVIQKLTGRCLSVRAAAFRAGAFEPGAAGARCQW